MNYLRLFLLLLFLYGCNKEKLKAPDAFFIQPEGISVNTTTNQGTSSHKITDIWYYVNGKFKGTFPKENAFPIPSIGQTEIIIYPGIKNNGISGTRQPYEFYEPIVLDTTVPSGSTINKNFEFKYKSGTVFKWLENFESSTAGPSISKSNNSDTTFTILNKLTNPNADVFEGNKCLYFGLDDTRIVAQFQSTSTFNLPKSGAPVYLELNYKCNQPFDVGVYSTNGGYTYVSSVNTSYEWNKIYIQLSIGVNTNIGTSIGWYIKTAKQVENPQFYIDNIKILSY